MYLQFVDQLMYFVWLCICRSVGNFITRLVQISDSTDELTKMPLESERTIREHCDSIRHKVDIARETAIENIHKASNALMTDIDAYENECLSGWRAVKASTEHVVEKVTKRMKTFIVEQQEYLQSVQASGLIELILKCFAFK